MTVPFQKGRYGVRLAVDAADLLACQRLRHRSFFGADGVDADAHDAACQHLLIESADGIAGCLRVFTMPSGAAVAQSYAAARYDLSGLRAYDRPLLELGRVCIAPWASDGDVLRLAWGALTRMVGESGAGLIFGCTSFAGTDPAPYRDAFGLLANRYQGPGRLRPGVASPDWLPLSGTYDPKRAVQGMPALLRTYLGLGGWVGDHAVIDREMNTLHVFTALEVDRVPARRAVTLRGLAV